MLLPMRVEIRYCQMGNYKPRAASLAAAIRKARGMEVQIEPGGRGQFDIFFDEKLIYSKETEGRFPEHDEVFDELPAAAAPGQS